MSDIPSDPNPLEGGSLKIFFDNLHVFVPLSVVKCTLHLFIAVTVACWSFWLTVFPFTTRTQFFRMTLSVTLNIVTGWSGTMLLFSLFSHLIIRAYFFASLKSTSSTEGGVRIQFWRETLDVGSLWINRDRLCSTLIVIDRT